MAGVRQSERGTAVVEFALAMPIFIFTLLVSFQLALIITQYYGVRNIARDTARWLAINPDTDDAALRSHALGLVTPTLDPAGFVSVTSAPSCPSLSGGHCVSRQSGNIVTVTIQYDVTSKLFLPTTFGWSGLTVRLPTRLPAYSVSEMIE